MTRREMVEAAIKVCKKHKKLFEDVGITDFSRVCNEAEKALYAIVLEEDYGFRRVTPSMVINVAPSVYVNIDNGVSIVSMGEKYGRTITWPTDGRQPVDEVILMIRFPTGPYVIDRSYPEALFREMWAEFKSYDFKYIDDVNHCIYFPLDKAAPVANAYRDILQKYRKRFKDEADIRRIAELKQELEKLEGVPHD